MRKTEFTIGRKVYFAGIDGAVRGTIVRINNNLVHTPLITIETDDGKTITGYETQFSFKYPAIYKFFET